MFGSYTPELYEPPRHAFAPHVASGYTDQQNSQPGTYRGQPDGAESSPVQSLRRHQARPGYATWPHAGDAWLREARWRNGPRPHAKLRNRYGPGLSISLPL